MPVICFKTSYGGVWDYFWLSSVLKVKRIQFTAHIKAKNKAWSAKKKTKNCLQKRYQQQNITVTTCVRLQQRTYL